MSDDIGSETDGCDLGDKRLNVRYRVLLERLGNQPQLSIPAACRGKAEVEAAYRFFDHHRVTPTRLLAPHQAATRRRMAEQTCVIVAQDTTEIDLTRPERIVGGPLADDHRCGFFSHVSLAITTSGVPLGVLANRIWSRDSQTIGQSAKHRKRQSIDQKESQRWIEGYRVCCEAARALPGVEVISVSDSEGDIYEALVEAQTQKHVAKFIVRACQDRRLIGDEQQYLWAAVSQTPVLGTRVVSVSERKASPSETRKRRKARDAREAVLAIQAVTVTPRAPWRPDGKLPSVPVTVVRACEVNPPTGEEPIEWLLLSNLPARTCVEAERVLDGYTHRWLIEVYFRVLKSGCGVEKLQLETAERMQNALTVYQVVAWRVLLLTMLGRSTPNVSCETVLAEAEWKAVYVVVLQKKAPKIPPLLGVMVRLIAMLGGHLGRTNDPPPGPKAMWVGLQQARTLARGWETFGPDAKTYA
jgi:hypothetical protein